MPLARWVQSGGCPSFIAKTAALSEVFGHGLGVVLLVIVIAVLDPWHRYAIPRIMGAALGSGIAADALKLFLGRTRPLHFDLDGSGLDSFSSWLPMLGNHSWDQSFPSSHTAVAAGLAVVMAAFYPRGRWLFPALAVLAGAQRVFDQYHYLSDVLWGGAIGCIFAPLCVYGSRLAATFDRLEAWLIARRGPLAAMRPVKQAVNAVPSAGTQADVPRAA